ncbi:aminoglycoside phosphotransferase family protein [Guyparkeria sp. TX1]|uniref:aminoglycoside phosphotransferase family protein n=1 Tax=Guyparkeria sp. TX1 TaxID=3115001 RepID=UPI0039779049
MTDTAATDPRREAAHAFLERHAPGFGALRSASSDASNRRYWRAQGANGKSLVVMDSPPDKEPLDSFLDVQARLEQAGLPVPHIHARDLEGGFLLLDDLGNDTLFSWQAGAEPAARANALAECRMQLVTVAQVDRDDLPLFDAPRLITEMQLFDDWYRTGHLDVNWSDGQTARWAELRDRIASRLAAMPPVFVHRDYHSRNLMRGEAGWAIIDFQDAVAGPLAYDLVSLLRDSYIDWPTDWIEREIVAFWQQARAAGLTEAGLEEFIEDFAWVAVQRHLKVLGIFARLSRRDGKHGYLDDLPLTWRHLQWALDRAPELAPLRELITGLEPENARG